MSTAPTHDHDREPWQRLRGKERCEVCDEPGWCRYTSRTVECMRQREGADHIYVNNDGRECYLHRRGGQHAPPPRPTPAAPPDRTVADPARLMALYNDLVATLARPAPPDARRFGDHAAAVATVEDAVCFPPAAEVLRWIKDNGRWQDAIAAGVVHEGKLAGALSEAKVYVYREHGQARNLKGRKLDPAAKVKALNLHGTREARGCGHVLYQHDQLDHVADRLLVIAGGPAKVDACLAVGFRCVGGEEALSDAQIAAIAAAHPAGVVIVADGEDAKAAGELSPGQRHALAMGERLEEIGGVAVRVAEPARAPGSPKVDADSLLRDGGPGALRALVRAALPLATYRRAIGAEQEPAPPALIADLRAQLHLVRAERDQAREWSRLTFATLRAGHGTTPKMKTVGRAGLGLVVEWDSQRHRGRAEIDPETGERWVELDLGAAGEHVGLGDDAAGASLSFLCKEGLAHKRVRRIPVENPAPGQFPYRNQLLVQFPQGTKEAAVAAIAALRPETRPDQQPHGGPRTPRCERHPDAGTKTTITRETACAECGEVLERTILREEWHDADGAPAAPPSHGADVKPQDAGDRLRYTEGDITTPVSAADLKPHLAVLPPRLPRCLNYRGEGKGCAHRVDRDGDRYCAVCVGAGEGWSNAPPAPPRGATGYAVAAGAN